MKKILLLFLTLTVSTFSFAEDRSYDGSFKERLEAIPAYSKQDPSQKAATNLLISTVMSGVTGALYMNAAEYKELFSIAGNRYIGMNGIGVLTEGTIAEYSAFPVLAAGATGYAVGTLIVHLDEAYFHGILVSKTGDLLGPINRRIYNLVNTDTLPEILETDNGDLKVVKIKAK